MNVSLHRTDKQKTWRRSAWGLRSVLARSLLIKSASTVVIRNWLLYRHAIILSLGENKLHVQVVAAPPCTVSRANDVDAPKTIDKRIVIAPAGNALSSTAKSSNSSSFSVNAGSPSALPAALRPPTARPGDIGFGGAAGFRMRPPAALASSATRRGTGFSSGTSASRGGGGSGGGSGSVSSSGRGKGATALTAAAVAKTASPAEPPSWSGRLRSEKASCSLTITAGARGAGGASRAGVGSRAVGRKEDVAAAATIMAKLARGGGASGGGGGGGGGVGGENVETLQEQVGAPPPPPPPPSGIFLGGGGGNWVGPVGAWSW